MDNMTREELKQVMREVMLEILDERATSQNKVIDKEWLSITEAVEFLDQQGYITTKDYIYQLRFKGAIPYAKINGKLSFNRDLLREWAKKQRTFDSEESKRNAAMFAAKSARRRVRIA